MCWKSLVHWIRARCLVKLQDINIKIGPKFMINTLLSQLLNVYSNKQRWTRVLDHRPGSVDS